MLKPNLIEFERLARAYLVGEVPWDAVHQYAIEMEWKNAMDFPVGLQSQFTALHSAFLTADEKDDPQFRRLPSEIAKLLDDLDRAQAKLGRG